MAIVWRETARMTMAYLIVPSFFGTSYFSNPHLQQYRVFIKKEPHEIILEKVIFLSGRGGREV